MEIGAGVAYLDAFLQGPSSKTDLGLFSRHLQLLCARVSNEHLQGLDLYLESVLAEILDLEETYGPRGSCDRASSYLDIFPIPHSYNAVR